MTRSSKATRTAAVLMFGMATAMTPVLSVSAMAQAASTAPEADAPQVEAAPAETVASYDDATLENFIDAAMNLSEVQKEYTLKVKAAGDDSERQALADEASGKMKQAVDQTEGMSVEKYVEIGKAADQDEALAARITAMVNERQAKPMGDG